MSRTARWHLEELRSLKALTGRMDHGKDRDLFDHATQKQRRVWIKAARAEEPEDEGEVVYCIEKIGEL